MALPSITAGGKLQAYGQSLFEDQRRQEQDERESFFRRNPDARMLSPLASYQTSMGLSPNVRDINGMQALFGLLGRNSRMKGGASAPDSNQLRGSFIGHGEDRRDYPAGINSVGTFTTPQGFDLLDEEQQNLASGAKNEAALRALLRSGRLS